MKDYGQLIAIALGIIILVINALNKKKPKHNIPTPQPKKDSTESQPNTGIPSLDDILREFSGETTTPIPQSLEVEPSSSYETLETTNSLEETSPYEKYNSTDYQFSYEPLSKPNHSEEEIRDSIKYHEPQHLEEIIEKNEFEFNIRHAILYSEILKRPNY